MNLKFQLPFSKMWAVIRHWKFREVQTRIFGGFESRPQLLIAGTVIEHFLFPCSQ